MTRTSFIHSLIALFGLSVLPSEWVKQYRKIYLLQCFVRGFQFHKGTILLSEMKEGDMLELVREPENEHDDCAIALHFNNQMIGYIPRESNEMLSRLIDAQVVELQAEITHIEPKARTWENLHIAVYVLKEITGAGQKDPAYLTTLETPRYYTLKHRNDKISRIYHPGNNSGDAVYAGDDFYRAITGSYTATTLPPALREQDPATINQAAASGRMIINRNRLPDDLTADALIRAIDDSVIALDNYFDEDGFVVAQINRLAALPDRINGFINIADKNGNAFIEVLMGNT